MYRREVKRHHSAERTPPVKDDEAGQLNGSESQERQKDRRRSLSKEVDKTLRGRESDPEKAARNSRNDDATLPRSMVRERVRPSDGDVASGDRVWSPQPEEMLHEKVRQTEDGTSRGRRSRHRVNEPVLKESEIKEKAAPEKRVKKVKRR